MKKILLVSHQRAFLERNKNLLDRAGFLIFTATTAQQALQAHREHPVDVIISMLDLPGFGGDWLCSAVRKETCTREVSFILVCYDTESAVSRASRCGANARVIKPVYPERLLEAVGRFVKLCTRRDYRASFTAVVRGTRETLPFSGVTHNISTSGILCESAMLLNDDDLISNLLLYVESHEILADGKVVRSERRADGMYNYGVQFTSIPTESVQKIEQFVSDPARESDERPGFPASQPDPFYTPLPAA